MRKFMGSDNGTGKIVLTKLKMIQLRFRETEVEWITIIQLGVDNRGGDGTGHFENKVGMNTMKCTNMRIAGFKQSRNLIWELDVHQK